MNTTYCRNPNGLKFVKRSWAKNFRHCKNENYIVFSHIKISLVINQEFLWRRSSIVIQHFPRPLIIMTQKALEFTDKHCMQVTKALMGKASGPHIYVTLYFVIHEINTIHPFSKMKYNEIYK